MPFRLNPYCLITKQFVLVGYVGKKCHLASSLDSSGKLSLVKSAVAGYTSGKDLRALGGELSELSGILVVDIVHFILAEDANLLSSVHRTERGTLTFVSFHFNGHNLSDSRFQYCRVSSEPCTLGKRSSLIRKEGRYRWGSPQSCC